jgi:hypothetical protein
MSPRARETRIPADSILANGEGEIKRRRRLLGASACTPVNSKADPAIAVLLFSNAPFTNGR